MPAGQFAYFFAINQLTLVYFCFFGLMCVYLTPNAGLASVCGNLLYSMWHLFSGFLIAKPVRTLPDGFWDCSFMIAFPVGGAGRKGGVPSALISILGGE